MSVKMSKGYNEKFKEKFKKLGLSLVNYQEFTK